MKPPVLLDHKQNPAPLPARGCLMIDDGACGQGCSTASMPRNWFVEVRGVLKI